MDETKLEIALLIEKCSRNKFELNKIKDKTTRILIELIVKSKQKDKRLRQIYT